MTLLDQISEALGASGALGDLSSTLGASAADTDSLLSAGLPAILGGLGAQAGGDGASAALFGLLGESGGFADNIGSFFAQGDKTGLASKLVGSLFGSQRGAIESHVSDASGGAMSMVSRFLPMLAPAVLGLLGKITADDDDLDADSLTSKLAAFGGAGALGDILGNSTDDDRAGFLDGIASLRDAGGLAALVPAASAAAPVAAAAATGAAAASAGAVATLAGGPDDDSNRSGLAWLMPVLLPLLALIAGLVLWQCTGSSTDDAHGDDTHSEEVAEAAPVAAAPAEPTVAPTAVPTAAPTPEPTAAPTPEPTPEPAPVVTIADLAVGSNDLSTLVGLAGDLDLVGLLSDPEAGPFTVFAPTNGAFDAAGPVLERLDGDQTRAAVTYHVVPGVYTAAQLTAGVELETVAGETLVIGENVTLPNGASVVTADLVAANGIVHVIDGVLVPGSIQRALATADVNALFVLEPIQFATGSAEILPASVPTLDQAIATLTSLPAGTRYEVQGHTDSQGADASNQTLSEERAASVVAYLVAGGVDGDILEANGYGETQLKVDPEVTPEDFAANRRIEFVDISGQ